MNGYPNTEYYSEQTRSDLAVIKSITEQSGLLSEDAKDLLFSRVKSVSKQIASYKDFADHDPHSKPGAHCYWLARELRSDLEKVLGVTNTEYKSYHSIVVEVSNRKIMDKIEEVLGKEVEL